MDDDERAFRKERPHAASVEEVEEERSVPQAVEADLRESRVAAAAEGEPAREESEIDRSESRARESASESVEEAHEGWWWVAVEEEREPWKRSGGGSGEQVESESSSRLVEVRGSCSCKRTLRLARSRTGPAQIPQPAVLVSTTNCTLLQTMQQPTACRWPDPQKLQF